MVPGPWSRQAAAQYRGEDIGVHLTLNAEHDLYRWGPLTRAPSLLDGDGGFPRTTSDLWDHADLEEVRRDPDAIGYQNNVNTLNANPSNLRNMIFIFIYSTEYRQRFGPG